MEIVLDAMGGDHAPFETVKGAILALNEIPKLKMILVGHKEKIEQELIKYKYDKDRVEIIHTDEVIEMNEKKSPAMAVREKKNASMNIALQLVKEKKAYASVSAGNTGALMSASLLKLGRIKGVLRPAITTVFPSKKGKMILLDVGANADCKSEYLKQFAMMGSFYAKMILKKDNPKIGILNIGTEEGKGNSLTNEAYQLLNETKDINFIGNTEPGDIFKGDVDVIVTDGFTGNIVLKTSEGIAKLIFDIIKESLKDKFISKIGALLMKPIFINLKERMDYSEYGGALFLGLDGISIKSHGSSDAKAIKNGIKIAYFFAENNFVGNLKEIMKGEKPNG